MHTPLENVIMCLELMPVVEKPEIVKEKEDKSTNLGQKYVKMLNALYKLTLH